MIYEVDGASTARAGGISPLRIIWITCRGLCRSPNKSELVSIIYLHLFLRLVLVKTVVLKAPRNLILSLLYDDNN